MICKQLRICLRVIAANLSHTTTVWREVVYHQLICAIAMLSKVKGFHTTTV